MKNLFLLLGIYLMGFLSAIPVGPAQIEIAKRSLNNHLRSAVIVVLGSISSVFIYGIIALFGVVPLFSNLKAIAIFELCGAVIFWILAFFTFKEGTKPHFLGFNRLILKSKRIAFITGFSLSVVNPMMIFWWFIGVQIMRNLDLVDTFTPVLSLSFVLVGVCGIATYLTTLATVLHWVKKFISDKTMRKVYFALGVALIILSIVFLISSLKVLVG